MNKWIIGFMTLALAAFCAVTFAATPQLPTGIVVTGNAVLEKEPDQTQVYFVIHTTGKTSEEAQAENAKISSQVYQAFMADGIDRSAWKTVQMDLSPEYVHDDSGKGKLKGYQMNHGVLLTVSGTDKAGKIVNMLVGSGVENIQYIRFGLKDPKAAQREALAEATKDARARAEIIAAETGATIKSVRYVSEPRVVYQDNAGYADMSRNKEESAPVEQQVWAGSVNITATVEIHFELVK